MMNNQFCGNDKNHTDEEAETNKTGCERRIANDCTDTIIDFVFVISITFVFVFVSLLLLWVLFEHISSTRNNTCIVVIIVVVIVVVIIIIIIII